MTALEDRLRAELSRSGSAANVSTAPSIDALHDVARNRRQRNRVALMGGGVMCFAVLLFGAFFATQPDDVTEVVAAGDGSSAEVADAPADASVAADSALADESADPVAEAPVDEVEEGAATAPVDDADASVAEEVAKDDTAAVVGTELQVDESPMDVETRESAVAFAGGSGVLLVDDGNGGYKALASRFEDAGAAPIGLESSNGLDWSEVEVEGVPAGATASLLESYDGTHVALFSKSNGAGNDVLIGTSSDLFTWTLSDPLPGREVFAQHLAVGPGGVLVLGDDFDKAVWTGPVGGPYEAQPALDQLAGIIGATVVGDEFVVVGRAGGDVTVLRSVDGIEWSQTALSSPGEPGANQMVRVVDGTIVLSSLTDEAGAATFISSDGGSTWTALELGPVSSVGVSASTRGFLSGSDAGATMTFADEATVATANIDVAAPDRLELLTVGDGEAVMLATTEDGLTWITVQR